MFAICNSTCELARICGRHKINAPDPRVRNQDRQKFEPEYGRDCFGFIDLTNNQLEDQHE
jgi:hypothetical protein